MSERKPAYPAHAPDIHEDEGEDDKPLVRPTTRKEPLEEGRDQTIDDEDLAPLAGRIQLLCWNKKCQGTRASEKRRP